MSALAFLTVATEFALIITEGSRILATATRMASHGNTEEGKAMLENSMNRYKAASDAYRAEPNPNEDNGDG